MQYIIKRTTEMQPNPVVVDGLPIGAVVWSGCFYTKRGRSNGYWYVEGDGTVIYKTMKAAAEALFKAHQLKTNK